MSKKSKQKEVKMDAPDEIIDDTGLDDAVTAALAGAEPTNMNAKALAAAEEQRAVQQIAAANRAAEDAAGQTEDLTETPLVSLAARGRETLLEAMRQHQVKKAHEPEYIPPARTVSQMSRLEEELEAGRRAQVRHEGQVQEQRALAARNAAPDPREGTSQPVHRPGVMVPNPKGGHGVYSPTA